MNIKVNRLALIDALNVEIAKREKSLAEQDKFDAEYEKAGKKRQDDIVKAIQSGKAKVKEVGVRYWTDRGNEISVTLVLPASIGEAPERKYTNPCYPRHQLDEIRSAVALLNLSDETSVSASTYKHVAQYLV